MILRILDRTGHTEVAGTIDEIVTQAEAFMNEAGKRYTLLAEQPGQDPVRVDAPAALRAMAPETVVTALPQLVGG